MSFDEACELVVAHLKREVPLAFWSISRYSADRQLYLCVQDDAYNKVAGDSHAWSDSLCRHMVTGATPQIAPDVTAVPEYTEAGVARALPIGAYIGVPIRSGDGTLFGTICGLDPHAQPEQIVEHGRLVHLFATLLGQILHADHLRVEAADREAELRWSAFNDELTGLPNRALFIDQVERALELHSRDGRPIAVLLVDLDDFKAVNDTLGHAAGDGLLVLVAHRLRRALRPGDTLARLSGDEFAVLLEYTPDPTIAAGRMVTALAEPFTVSGTPITISASIGVTELGKDAKQVSVDAVLAHADIAMYAAKRAGKGRFTVYDTLMTLPGTRTLQLREPLHRAVGSGAITAVYQPIVALDSGRLIGFEALARWQHDGEVIAPDVFIPIAASSGLMPALTDHMLDVACAQIARWSTQLGHRDLRVSVNISPRCISDPSLPRRVSACIRRHGILPRQLAVEITEDALLHDLATAVTVARRLQALGVVLSLDDFGAGYSSLLHLQQIPLHSIKIDRGFTDDIDTNPHTERFMRAVLALGRDLGLRVVVEGVERQAQADVLRHIGCRQAQGYLFGAPAPARDLPGAAWSASDVEPHSADVT